MAGKVAVMSDGIAAAAISTGRAERIHTIAQSQASVATRWYEVETARFERGAMAAAVAGFVGLALGLATLVPRLIPYEYAAYVTMGSLLCMAVPLAAATLVLVKRGSRPGGKLGATAARCRTVATLSQKLVKVIERLSGKDGLDLGHRDCLDFVLLDLEQEIDQVGQSLREAGGEGRHLRRDARIVPRHRKVVVSAPDGRRLTGTIADLSISGVAMTERLPYLALGHEVTIGSRQAKVARVWDNGIAFTFKLPLDVTMFSEDTVL